MGRTGQAENSQAQKDTAAQQAAANAVTMASIGKYNTDLSTLQSGKDAFASPYKSADYLSNLNRQFATTSSATANAGKAQLQDLSLRTGDNGASSIEGIKNMQREAQRAGNAGLNQQYATDVGRNIDYQTALLNADLAPTGASNSAYGTATSGRDAALGNLTQFGLASYAPWTSAIGAMGAAGGAALGNPALFGGAAKPTGCWIAEAIYGFDDVRTHLVRAWLNTEFTKKAVGRAVMALYRGIGQPIAAVVRRSALMKRVLKPLFDLALRRAEASRPVFSRRNWWDNCFSLLIHETH